MAIVVRVSIFWPDYCLNPRQAAPGRTALGKASTVLVASACSLSKLRELGHQRARECCIGGPDASGFRAPWGGVPVQWAAGREPVSVAEEGSTGAV